MKKYIVWSEGMACENRFLSGLFVWEGQLQVSHSSYLQATCVCVSRRDERERERVCVLKAKLTCVA